jgi:molybdopterin-containing oxidoreductase family iron-sulfur binding subunit
MPDTDTDNQPQPAAANQHGQAYWRSLDEYANSAAFRRQLAEEFPGYDPEELQSMSRRRFMQLAGASMALAGLTLSGCRRWPKEQIAPYARRPEGAVPGEPEQYATMLETGGVAQGLVATSYDGRPVKLEGNKEHPLSNGATDQFAQASILQLYDPDRSRQVAKGAGDDYEPGSWSAFNQFAKQHFAARGGEKSSSIAVLAEPSSSATRAALKKAFQQGFPQATWHEYEPINRDNEIEGLRAAFGEAVRPHYWLEHAKIIACFDSDLLSAHPAALKHARDWAKGRRSADEGEMNRLYVAESHFSVTGTNADHRLATKSSAVPKLIKALAARLGVGGGEAGDLNGASAFIEKLVKDLKAHPGEAVVAVGPSQPASVHTLVAAINDKLGAIATQGEGDKPLAFTQEPQASDKTQTQQLAELVERINAGEVDTLVMLGTNPVYNAPADVKFADAMKKVATTIHLGLYYDETAEQSLWHLPRAHYLEAWGDGRSWDGTRSIQQPLIKPLFNGKTPDEVLATLTNQPTTQSYDLVRSTFQRQKLVKGESFDKAWREALHDGLVKGSADKAVAISLQSAAVRAAMKAKPFNRDSAKQDKNTFEVTFNRDGAMFDGRWANNGWLQELPDPVTKVTWDNPALINIADAKQLGLHTGDLVKLTVADRTLELPVYLCPGQARGSIALKLGYGRSAAGHVGGLGEDNVGFDTYTLRGSDQPDVVAAATLKKAGGSYALASTQNHHLIDANAQKARQHRVGTKGNSGTLVREASLDEYKHNRNFAFDEGPHPAGVKSKKDVPLQLYEPPSNGDKEWPDAAWQSDDAKAPSTFNSPHAWGMTIDMNSCLGCNACVVACQAENNIPVVGKDEVQRGREMQWLRIDRYFKTDPEQDPHGEDPSVVHQPMMCVHCENAPCEQVCPVAATVHDTEGLNVMVYNRCIGTRYCSNNCPYKVRRFNYFDYHRKDPRGSAKPWLGIPDQAQQSAVGEIKRMMFNPEVTVRMRGVMEKCTYCVQRIKHKEIQAKNEFAQQKADGQPAEAGDFWHQDARGNVALNDGAVVTACQQACPTEAIQFGNLNDKDAAVTQAQRNPRSFGVLKELNTRPRTMHLAKIRNYAEA